MNVRELPPDEWGRLMGTELEAFTGRLDPAWATVLVVEQDGQIVGCWALLQIRHVEGLWVHPEHRAKGGVQRRLWLGMNQLITEQGGQGAMTAALTPQIEALLECAGATKLPGTHWMLPMGMMRCQQQS